MNADGSGLTRLTYTNGMDELSPGWSPDGERIAFISSPRDPGNPHGRIRLLKLHNRKITEVVGHPIVENFCSLTWSPDGRKIACMASIIDLVNGTVLHDHPGAFSFPVWSPNGKWIAGADWGEAESHWLKLVTADGRRSVTLAERSFAIGSYRLAWSPDGRKIAFTSSDVSVTRYAKD